MVTLQVTDAGTYFWNKEPISAVELGPRLESYKSQTKLPRVLISGDNRAKFGPTCYALDQVRKVGSSRSPLRPACPTPENSRARPTDPCAATSS
jgi:biopolymer transport protein ExbD